jgi:bifunctional DNA-binding transcriptional regulator/antitoxin component of YhaV-PrlF toxin-antitoxin module
MASLSGPHPISTQYQVKIPTKLARELHLQPGDEFYWRRSDDDSAVLTLIPVEVVERRYSAGEQAEAANRPRAAALSQIEADQASQQQQGRM